MEEVEAVGNLRAATAVFLYDGDETWSTGRRIAALSLISTRQQTVKHFQGQMESRPREPPPLDGRLWI